MDPASIPPGTDRSKVPLAPPPDGMKSNFESPPSLADPALVVGVTFTVASGIMIIFRIGFVFANMGRLALDDYLCMWAYALNIAYSSVVWSIRDLFRHLWDIPVTAITATIAQREFIISALSGPCLWSSKAAVLFLYLRLFGTVKWLRWTARLTLAISCLIYLSSIPIASVLCTPATGGPWGPSSMSACGRTTWMGPVQTTLSVIVDFVILILPLPVIKRLKLNIKKKIALGLVFLMGFFAFAAACVTLYFGTAIYASDDFTWNAPKIWISLYVETYITIMVSCAPAIHALWTSTVSKSNGRKRIHRGIHSGFTGFSASPSEVPMTDPNSTAQLVHKKSHYLELHDMAPADGAMPAIFKTTEIRQTSELLPSALLSENDPYGRLFE